MQAFRVVERHPPAHFHSCIVGAEIRVPADFFRLEGPVHAFNLPVALRMERGCRGLLQLKFRNEVQEVPRRELPPVIVDDAGVGIGEEFLRTGHEYLDVYRLHCREQVPDDDLAAEAVEDAGVLVGEGLLESVNLSLLRLLGDVGVFLREDASGTLYQLLAPAENLVRAYPVFVGDVRYGFAFEQDHAHDFCLVFRAQAATFLRFFFVLFCHKVAPWLEIYTLLAFPFLSKLRLSATPIPSTEPLPVTEFPR